ncbi:protein kinase [Isosphaeraceae bacterium EP7]
MDESWISGVAAQYETAFTSGQGPEIDAYLKGTTEPGRSKLLAELLRLDVSLRQARGDRPSLAEYVGRFPRDSGTVFEVLSAVGLTADEVDLLADSTSGSTAAVEEVPRTEELGPSPSWPLPEDPLKSTQAAGSHPPPGAGVPTPRVAGFESLELIGEGGMGKVYKARSPSLNHMVALKILPEECTDDLDRVARFRNEAELAASIDHPNVVGVMQLLMGPPLVLVMALVDGPDLGRLLLNLKRVRAGRPPEFPEKDHPFLHLEPDEQLRLQLSWLDQIVDAVACVNAMGILHRDLKPSNILIDGRGRARLTDFGLARLAVESLLTRTGQPMGTAGFSSPEQAAGHPSLDARADQFSLAVTIYQVLTMHLPYGRPRPGERLPTPTPPRAYQPKISADLNTVILRGMAEDRENRYATTDEFRDQWMAAREGRPIEAWRRRPLRVALYWVRNHAWGVSDALAAVVLVLILAFAPAWSRWGGGVNPPKPSPLRVSLVTQPAGARAVAVPLDPRTGEPDAAHLVRLRAGRASLPPGDYLVEVVWPDRRFHQVYRRVPEPGAPVTLMEYPHTDWKLIGDDLVTWPPVVAPPPDVDRGMAPIDGGEAFLLEPDRPASGPGPKPFRRDVRPFLLDTTEVTVGTYGAPARGKPDDPVTMVCYDEAVAYAERVGKRLLTEAEFKFSATMGGTRRYPWGNDPPTSWSFGPAGADRHDMLPTVPPVFGLCSNVAEWTCTTLGSDPSLAGIVGIPTDHLANQVVCGGGTEVVSGKLIGPVTPPDLVRVGQSRGNRLPGLGFRCARSRGPLYLDGPGS